MSEPGGPASAPQAIVPADAGMIARARLAYIALFVAVAASAPFLPVYYDALGVDVRIIPLVGALMAGAGLLGSPLWGTLSDRFPASRLVLPTAAVVAAIGALLLRLSPWPLLIVFVAVLGFGSSGIGPILDARAVEAFGSDRARYARLRVWGSASFVVASIGVGALVERFAPGSLFLVFIPALLVTGAIGLAIRPRGIVHMEPLRRFEAIGSVIRHPLLGRFLLAILVCWSSSVAINSFFSIYLGQVGASATLIGVSWAVGALVEIPLMFAFPALSRRFGIERLILLGAASLVVRAVLVSTLHDPVLLTLSTALHGSGFALLTVGSVAFVAGHAPRGAAATAQGVLTATSYSLATVLGPICAGLAASFVSLPVVFAIAGASSLIGAIVLGRVLLGRGAASSPDPSNGTTVVVPEEIFIEPGPGSMTGV